VSGGLFGGAMHLEDIGVRAIVVLVLQRPSRVNGEVIFVAGAGHTDIGHGAAGAIRQDRPADTVLIAVANGHALARSHGAGVTQGDVFPQVVAADDGAGAFGEPLGGDVAPPGVDSDHTPAIPVAHLVNSITAALRGSGFDYQLGVIAAAEHDIADADLLIAGHRHTHRIGVGEVVPEALVDGVGDFACVAEDCGILASARALR
jgi:hypothetical protein